MFIVSMLEVSFFVKIMPRGRRGDSHLFVADGMIELETVGMERDAPVGIGT